MIILSLEVSNVINGASKREVFKSFQIVHKSFPTSLVLFILSHILKKSSIFRLNFDLLLTKGENLNIS